MQDQTTIVSYNRTLIGGKRNSNRTIQDPNVVMSTDVLRLPRIEKSMTSVGIPSNRGAARSTVLLPSVTNPYNMKHRQEAKRRKRDKRDGISPQRRMREHSDRLSNMTSQAPAASEPYSNNRGTEKATEGGTGRELTYADPSDKRIKERGANSESSPYTNFRGSPLRGRTVASSSIDENRSSELRPHESSRTTRTETSGVVYRDNVVTLQQLARHRSTVMVYLDAGWKNSRKDRFYSTLEDAQVKQWKQKRSMALQQQKHLNESKERQIEQLRRIRNKHQMTRNRRLSTQHVKWKYVISGKEGDRKEYGLPSEYYTYYGFHPDKESATDDEKKGVQRSKTAQSLKKLQLSLEKEKEELRKRNLQKYEYLFATKRNTQLEMIQRIIRDGLYTLDVSDRNAANDSQPAGRKPHPLTKRASETVVVKNVIDDAKKVISDQGEIPSEVDSDSESDTNLLQLGKE